VNDTDIVVSDIASRRNLYFLSPENIAESFSNNILFNVGEVLSNVTLVQIYMQLKERELLFK